MVKLIAGVDEVGRGPLAGPVMAAAVILDPNQHIKGLADSKQLSAQKRERLASIIKERAIAWAIGRAECYEIDELNIFHASLLAMKRAIEALSIQPEHALIDGKFCPELSCSSEAIIKGDQKVASISAASIVAKVTRDHEMVQLADKYPGYGFERHKGYGTKLHMQALQELGACEIHRQSFAPVYRLNEPLEA